MTENTIIHKTEVTFVTIANIITITFNHTRLLTNCFTNSSMSFFSKLFVPTSLQTLTL